MGVLFGRLEISKLSLPKLSFPTLIFASSIGVPFSAFVTLKPVSYTHLDVYKSQVQSSYLIFGS